MNLPELWVVRHGETEWSRDQRHTSHTDLALTDVGERAAAGLRDRLADVQFDLVLCSPSRRARRTAELAGLADRPDTPEEVTEDAVEWDYGDYEGVTTEEIRRKVPGWSVWTHLTPGGETALEVSERCDRLVTRVRREAACRAIVVGHGHFLRALTARWLDQAVRQGEHYRLDTATVSVLGWERDAPVILRWNA